jgi:hypothetical protein
LSLRDLGNTGNKIVGGSAGGNESG